MNRNERIYPIYRMLGYDYLFYLAISFLFLTITKGLTVGQIMYLSAFSAVFIGIFQIPTNYIVEKIGLKKSMVFGGALWIIHMLIVLFGSNFYVFVIAEAICALGTCLKSLSETQMLYATLKQTNNRKKFSEIEGKGVSWHYYFEAISSIFLGALFLVNNYIPMILTLTFGIIAFIISLAFDEIADYMPEKHNIKQYLKGFKLVLKSKRIICIFIYSFVMSGIIIVVGTLQKSTIVELGVNATEYSLIFAAVTLCIGIGSSLQHKIEEILKRKTLSTIGYSYTVLILMLGVFNIIITDKNIALVITIAILIMQNILRGSYRISVKKYMNNFTTHLVRGKILSIFYIFESIGRSLLLFIFGMIIDNTTTNNTSVLLGIISLIVIFIIIKFMKDKLGLNPDKYSKEDVFGMDVSNEK